MNKILENTLKTLDSTYLEKFKELKNELFEKVENQEVERQKKNTNFKCETCNFTTTSKAGLKIHMKRKHTEIDNEQFPKSCELCDKILKSKSQLKVHLQEHSYKLISYQCSFCNFIAEDRVDIDIHIGKEHEKNIQCGLCAVIVKDIAELETHLAMCEIYKCEKCGDVFKNLKDLKVHFLEDHKNEKSELVEHIKQNRINSEIYDIRAYSFKDLFQHD